MDISILRLILAGFWLIISVPFGNSLAGPGHHKHKNHPNKPKEELRAAPRLKIDRSKKGVEAKIGKSVEFRVKARAGDDFSGEVTYTLEHYEWDEIDKENCLETAITPSKGKFEKNGEQELTITLTATKKCPLKERQHFHIMLWIQRDGESTQHLQNVEIPFSMNR